MIKMNSEVRLLLAGFFSDLSKIGGIVLLVLSILFFSTMTVNFFIHCEYATIFKKYNLCYYYTPTGFNNSSWRIKAPDDWNTK